MKLTGTGIKQSLTIENLTSFMRIRKFRKLHDVSDMFQIVYG